MHYALYTCAAAFCRVANATAARRREVTSRKLSEQPLRILDFSALRKHEFPISLAFVNFSSDSRDSESAANENVKTNCAASSAR